MKIFRALGALLFCTSTIGLFGSVTVWASSPSADARVVAESAGSSGLSATDDLRHQAKLTGDLSRPAAEGEPFDFFGLSVAVSGDTVLVGAEADDVGANLGQGSAYVFRRRNGNWELDTKLVADDGAGNDGFGSSVALDGDTAVIGAIYDATGGNTALVGSAYVFQRSGEAWVQQAKLTAPDAASGDRFGGAVSVSGDTALVGAASANQSKGAAYVFVRDRGNWSQQTKLTAFDGSTSDSFGISVAISGNTALIGALFDAVGPNFGQGSAYAFVRNAGIWTLQTKLTAADGAGEDLFGRSVALSGDLALVGALSDDVGANFDQGSAYVFRRNSTSWTQQAKLMATDGAGGHGFGRSVSLSGTSAVISGPGLFSASQSWAYVFLQDGSAWNQQAKLVAGGGVPPDSFPFAVAISGDVVVLGAELKNVSPNQDQGTAFVFERNGGIWTERADLDTGDGAAEDAFGSAVALSGEFALMGAPFDYVAGVRRGSAYVFKRISGHWVLQAKLVADAGSQDDMFGFAVAINGDFALVGAPDADRASGLNQGSAFLFRREGSSWNLLGRVVANDGNGNDRFGASVALSANHAMIGAPRNEDNGSVYVFERGSDGLVQSSKLRAAGGARFDQFGATLALSGDAVLIGAPFAAVGQNQIQGSAYIFQRTGMAWSEQARLIAFDGTTFEIFGRAVALFGDTAIVGLRSDSIGGNSSQGSAYVFIREFGNWSLQSKLKLDDGAQGDAFGSSVAIHGNVALISSPEDNVHGLDDQGSVSVFERSGATWTLMSTLTANDGAANELFGSSVALSDTTALVGASGDDGTVPYGNRNEGSAYVYVRTQAGFGSQPVPGLSIANLVLLALLTGWIGLALVRRHET